ncbi:MAG TPA: thioesterase family protein [Candidatus Acidoferrales bacterium]
MLEHDAIVRVRYAETDRMGVAYHSNFLIWFEIGRVEMLRSMGVRYREMEDADDCNIVVVEVHCQYKKSAVYDDVLRIRTRMTEVRKRTVRFAYQVLRDPSGELLATGETAHVVCGRDGRPKSLPEKYRALFAAAEPAGQPDQGSTSPR